MLLIACSYIVLRIVSDASLMHPLRAESLTPREAGAATAMKTTCKPHAIRAVDVEVPVARELCASRPEPR